MVQVSGAVIAPVALLFLGYALLQYRRRTRQVIHCMSVAKIKGALLFKCDEFCLDKGTCTTAVVIVHVCHPPIYADTAAGGGAI